MNNKTLARVGWLVAFFVLVYFIRGVVFPIVMSIILFYILDPLVNLLEKMFPKKMPLKRDLSIVASMVIFGLFLLLLFEYFFPPLINEFNQLVAYLPQLTSQAQGWLASGQKLVIASNLPPQINQSIVGSVNGLINYMVAIFQSSLLATFSLFGQVINLVIIPVIVYYAQKDKETLVAGWLKLVPDAHRFFADDLLKKINAILKNYIEGQLVICSTVGIILAAGLYLYGVNYFLVLGFVAAVTEIIPIIGPLIGTVPAVVIAYFVSPATAASVAIFYLVVQMLGNLVIAPKIMGNKLDLHPLTIILAVMVLGSLIGVWGVFFAAPITAMLKVVYLELKKG